MTISIHALREEGDISRRFVQSITEGFLSTPSARRATSWPHFSQRTYRFLSTPSARRATAEFEVLPDGQKFLSTPSARRATRNQYTTDRRCGISIHALREEGD